jgi:hypothetical protein
MRGIARAMFARPPIAVTAEDWIQLNGGLPEAVPPEVSVQDESGGKRRLTFVSESGLRIPALLWSARGEERAFAVLVSENGKTAAVGEFAVERLRDAGISCLAVDPRGLGELKGLDLRLTTYLGQAPTFLMGWDIVRSIAALVPPGVKVALVGRGPSAGMAVLAASLIEPRVGWVGGISTLRDFTDAFDDGVPLLAVQPRANYAPSLEGLRGLVKAEAIWSFLNEPEPGWEENLIGWVHR